MENADDNICKSDKNEWITESIVETQTVSWEGRISSIKWIELDILGVTTLYHVNKDNHTERSCFDW